MGKTCEQYSFEDINLFVDNELPQNKTAEMARHCKSCETCAELAARISSIESAFNRHIAAQTQRIPLYTIQSKLKNKLGQNRFAAKKAIAGNVFGDALGVFSKNIYLKLSGIAAILIVGLAVLNGTAQGPSGPSAIVNYVDTELPYVMIIETQKQKHTIIWFSEA